MCVDDRGSAGLEFRVIDAEAIDLPDGSVDAVACRMGYMLMDNLDDDTRGAIEARVREAAATSYELADGRLVMPERTTVASAHR
jgi:hypothetical protein